MNTYTNCLPAWSVGPDCYREVYNVVRRYGKTAAVVGGKTALSKAYDKLAAAEGSRPLPANLPQKGLQRQSYGPGRPGPYRTAKNTPAPSQKRRRGVAYPCKIRPAYTAGR